MKTMGGEEFLLLEFHLKSPHVREAQTGPLNEIQNETL